MSKPLSQFPFAVGEEKNGDPLPEIYVQLKKIAGAYMRRERSSHTLQLTALVHEAIIQLGQKKDLQWKDRTHFLASAAQMMRWILLDYAKARRRDKRGGGNLRVTFNENVQSTSPDMDLIDLDDALKRLAEDNPRLAQVVELRFFGGLSVEEVASVLNTSPRTVKREWRLARAWLYRELGTGTESGGEDEESP